MADVSAVQDCLTFEGGIDRMSRTVSNIVPRTSNITEERRLTWVSGYLAT